MYLTMVIFAIFLKKYQQAFSVQLPCYVWDQAIPLQIITERFQGIIPNNNVDVFLFDMFMNLVLTCLGHAVHLNTSLIFVCAPVCAVYGQKEKWLIDILQSISKALLQNLLKCLSSSTSKKKIKICKSCVWKFYTSN